MIDVSEIRSNIRDLINERITLQEFESWLSETNWNCNFESPKESQELVWSIELALFEYFDRKWLYNDLIERFKFILN